MSSILTTSSMAQINKPAPEFKAEAVMPDGKFSTISLSDYRGKWVVLFFYPLDFTFVCPTEIIAFSEMAEKFKAINCEVIGASVDSVFTHLAWIETPRNKGGLGKMNIPLIADLTHKIGEDYGCLLESGHHCRATYIIDPEGVVRHLSLNDPPVGRNVDEYLRLVEGYQYVAAHGEVCPANWKKGAKTIKPDPKEKLAFFDE